MLIITPLIAKKALSSEFNQGVLNVIRIST